MGSITVEHILEFVAGAIILFQFGKWLVTFANPFVELRKRVDKHDTFLESDKKKIEELTKKIDELNDGLATVGIAIAEMINHEVTGNDVDELKEQHRELTKFFFNDKKERAK